MLSENNFRQRQLLLSLQLSWLEFKVNVMEPGVELDGRTLIAVRLIESEIRKLSTGPESWARGSKPDQEVSLEGDLKLTRPT